jgi:hypothetical protein
MNSNEQKIREAYERAIEVDCCTCNYSSFEAGYLALLNGLEPVMLDHPETFYRLPEGVSKCSMPE